MYVCMYVCMYIYMYVCMYVCIYSAIKKGLYSSCRSWRYGVQTYIHTYIHTITTLSVKSIQQPIHTLDTLEAPGPYLAGPAASPASSCEKDRRAVDLTRSRCSQCS